MNFEKSSSVEVSPEYTREVALKLIQEDIERLKGAESFMKRIEAGEGDKGSVYNLTVEEIAKFKTSGEVGDRIAELEVMKDEVEQGNLDQSKEFVENRMGR